MCIRDRPDQALAEGDLARQALAVALGVAGEQLELRVAAPVVGHVEGGLLSIHQGRQLAQYQSGNSDEVAMPLQHAREAREVRLEPVLLGVLARGVLELSLIHISEPTR